jgi:succinate dehydrogenase / fumarate reductase iron-sulfur subunit
MNLTLKVWRQAGPAAAGGLKEYKATGISPDMSFLEMLDIVNEGLIAAGEVPIAFDHDCREGICGSCGMMINGVAHGPMKGTATCQLHMRSFRDGDTLVIEPWRARAFPVVKDLVVNRSALDRIIGAGGYVTVSTGGAKDGNTIPVPKVDADAAMDAAACIGCGACVAACPNGSASLFTSAKISHLGLLPQGQPERSRRALQMVAQMDLESFGGCTLFGECQEACPKEISIDFISRMNRDFLLAALTARDERKGGGGDG